MQGPLRVSIMLDLTGTERVDQRLQIESLIEVILVSKERHNYIRCLLRMVERNPGEQVVDNVIVNDFVEEVASDKAESSIDRAKCAFDKGPGLLIIVWDGGVSVMQVGDGDCLRKVRILRL